MGDVRDFIDRGWRQWDAIDKSLSDGAIDENGWYRAVQDVLVPAYLNAPTPQAQSGHSGDDVTWREGRGFLVEAIERDGTFVDIGCANGYLMETARLWAAERGYKLEPYGLDLSPELVQLAMSRLPHWRDRFWTGNGLDWQPPFRFDFVHLQELDYVPPNRQRQLVGHLLNEVCKCNGRLLIGPCNELSANNTTETALREWGYVVAGKLERPHRHPEVVRRLLWLDSDLRKR